MYTNLEIITAIAVGFVWGSFITYLVMSGNFKRRFERMEREHRHNEIFS